MNTRSLKSFIMLTALFLTTALGAVAEAASTAAEITGEIERLTLNEPANIYSGGVMIIGGTQVILPKNLLIDLPANRLSLQQIFTQAPAACVALGESGLAKADKCNSSGGGGFATLSGVHSNAGNVIAGDVLIEKGKEVASGVVSYINYTDGYFRVNGIPGDASTGVMVRLNDPTSRHTIQQGAGCAGGPNCSADPRFTLDPDNYVITFSSGYPVCLPSTVSRNFPGLPAIPASGIAAIASGLTQSDANGVGDRSCPSTNRTPGLVVEPDVNDSRVFAPLVVGDSVNAEGNYEAINGTRFLSAHTMRVNKALSTKGVAGQPDYMFLEEVFVEAPGFQNQRARMLIIGFTTLAPTDVDFWTIHRDATNNAVHEFPLASIQGCDNAAGAGSCGTLGLGAGAGAGNNIFRIRYDVDFLLARTDPQGRYPGGARNDLNPCWQLLNSPRFNAKNPGLCPGATPNTTTGAGITLENNFGIMSPIPHEIQARTGHLLDAPAGSLVTLDINGNTATNGQYLFPFGMNLGGIETADFLEIDVNLLNTPRVFEGIPWNLDRRLSPSGCLNAGGCEAGALGSYALDPFPYTGLDPRLQAPALTGGQPGGTPKGTYNDPNFTTSALSTAPYGASNRVFTYVTAAGKANGNITVLPYVLGSFPADPPLEAINPTPVLNIFPPIADEDAATTTVGVAVIVNVLANDIPVLGSIDPFSVKVVSTPANGTAVVNFPSGTITYTPAANFSGTDTFTYSVANNFGSISLPGTVTVSVQRKPVAVNDTATVPAKSAVTITLVANDTAGTNPINLSSVNIVSAATCGTVFNNLDGDVLFTAPQTVPAGAGTCTFSYVVGDTNVPPLLSNVATVTVTITPSLVPVAVNDTASTTTGTPVIISVLTNDTITSPGVINPASVAVTAPTGGTAAANLDGTVTYTPPATPGSFTFTYTVQNSTALISNVSTVTVTVTQGHIAPVAVADPVSTTTGTTVNINVIGNDTATAPSALNPASLSITTPTGGTAVGKLNGTIDFTAPATPGTYFFTYTVNDNFSTPASSNVATVTVSVAQGTVPPVAANDTAVVNTGATVIIDVVANDTATAPDIINPLSTVVTAPTGGTAIANINGNGTVTYTAPATPGIYTFTYTVKDNHVPPQTSNVATVSVHVSSPGSTVTLTDLPGSPQLPGAQITFTASATGGSGSYEYDFWVYNGTAWNPARTYSTIPTWVWDTTGLAPGNYQIAAHSRNAGTASFADASVFLPYTITTPAASVVLTPNIVSPQLPGTTVTFSAAASGGSGTYEYRFWVFNGSTWTMGQNYSPLPTFTWNTTGLAAGNYQLAVEVRNVGATANREAVFYLDYALTTPVTSVSVISNLPSPHPAGTPVIFAASGVGGSGTYEYEFSFFNGATWTLVKPYNGTDTWTLPGTTPAGNYVIGVNARNAGASNVSDAVIYVPYVVQ